MRGRAIVLTAAAGLLAGGCSPGTEPLNTSSGLTFVADPSAFFLAAGEVQTVVVNSVPIANVPGTVRWSTTDANVVTVDSVSVLGAPTTVRAIAPGTATLRATVSATGNQVLLTVAVRVRAS